jgi:hypothetical protein
MQPWRLVPCGIGPTHHALYSLCEPYAPQAYRDHGLDVLDGDYILGGREYHRRLRGECTTMYLAPFLVQTAPLRADDLIRAAVEMQVLGTVVFGVQSARTSFLAMDEHTRHANHAVWGEIGYIATCMIFVLAGVKASHHAFIQPEHMPNLDALTPKPNHAPSIQTKLGRIVLLYFWQVLEYGLLTNALRYARLLTGARQDGAIPGRGRRGRGTRRSCRRRHGGPVRNGPRDVSTVAVSPSPSFRFSLHRRLLRIRT